MDKQTHTAKMTLTLTGSILKYQTCGHILCPAQHVGPVPLPVTSERWFAPCSMDPRSQHPLGRIQAATPGSSSMNWSSPDGSKRPACKFLAAGSLSSGYCSLLLWPLPTPFTHLQKKGHLSPRVREGLCKWNSSLCHLAAPRQPWALPYLKLPGWIPQPSPTKE